MRTSWRRIAAIPCFVFAPLLWCSGCSVWKPRTFGTWEGALLFAECFLPSATLLVLGCWLWKPLPK